MMPFSWGEHLCSDILPWWEQHAVDDEYGGVRTGFHNQGHLVTTDRFTWSQGRWAWLSGELADEARSGRLSVDADIWKERCLRTCERLIREAVRPDSRTHYRVSESGVPVADASGETATSVFADLFCVLGLSAGLRHLRADDPRANTWATIALDMLTVAHSAIEKRTALSEPYPVPSGFLDLAGPMTLLHTSAELLRSYETDQACVRRIRDWSAEQLIQHHLMSQHWYEFYPTSPGMNETMLARHVTPGHLLELLWMIEHAEWQDPGFSMLPPGSRASLALRAVQLGWDEKYGGLLRYADRDGGQPRGRSVTQSAYESLVHQTWSTKLWWVHAEAVYGLTLLGQRDPELAEWATRIADWTMKVFPEPDAEWIQIRDQSGAPLNQVVALPVKDPLHIARAALFMNRLLNDHEGGY